MFVIGLDVGTTGTKAILFDKTGKIHGQGYLEYDLNVRPGGYVEQSAKDWKKAIVHAVRTACRDVAPESVAAIGLSTQGSSLAVCDSVSEADNVITWMDGRAVAEAETLATAFGPDGMYRKSGWPSAPGGDASKILWLKNRGMLTGKEKFVSTLSYANHFLTGRYATDPTNGAIRQLFSVPERKWDEEILSHLGITEESLPEVLPTGALVGNLTKEAAGELGLTEAVQVFNGAHDQYCAALGCGAVCPGDMMLATGTTWVVLGVTDQLRYTKSHICPGVHPAGGYGAMASQVNAGSALKWWHSQTGDSYKAFDEEAQKRQESAADLFWVPYLAGSGFPDPDPEKRSRIVGLSLHHDKYDLARALMEGVAFETRRVMEEYTREGISADRLMMTGGATRSAFWSGIVAAVLSECSVFVSDCSDTSCLGAAMIAAVGCGMYSSFREAGVMGALRELERPDPEVIDYYQKKYETYCRILKSTY